MPKIITRLLVILLTLLAASFVATTVLLLGLLLPDPSAIVTGIRHGTLPASAAILTPIVLAYVAASVGVLIPIAEIYRLRSALLHAAAGVAVAMIDAHVTGWLRLRYMPALFAIAGLCGGLTYWAITGRKAGAWRDGQRRED